MFNKPHFQKHHKQQNMLKRYLKIKDILMNKIII